jgi:glycosyltransferase involved in cell wall biosynthesis
MDLKPLISIIVPVYNTSAYLDRCVESLRAQKLPKLDSLSFLKSKHEVIYEDIEIILVNDGSTDDSGAMCDHYAETDRRIRACHKENGGLVSAWQAGVRLSQGNYLCFVDSDDWVELEMLSSMAKHLDFAAGEIICCNHTIDRVIGSADSKTMAVSKVKHGLAPGVYEGIKLQEVFPRLLGNERRPIVHSRCMKLISKELIIDNLIYCHDKLKNGEDMNIMIPAILSSRRLVIMKDAYFYHYFYNTESMVHVYDAGLYENDRLRYKVLRNIFIDKTEERAISLTREEIDEQCGREYVLLLLSSLKNEARGNPDRHDYMKKIREICNNKQNREMISKYPLEFLEPQNRLLYLVLRHPSSLTFLGLRLATKIFYQARR